MCPEHPSRVQECHQGYGNEEMDKVNTNIRLIFYCGIIDKTIS